MPNFEQPIVVASLAALADIHVAELDDGTLAYVQASTSYFTLEKSNGSAPNGTTIIAPNAGSPIAGAAGARWVFLATAGVDALVTPFRFIPVPTATTASIIATDLLVASPVTVLVLGDILLDFDASIQITPSGDAGSFNGINMSFLWDGAPLASTAFFNNDMQAADVFNTFAEVVSFKALIVGATPGVHTLTVQWALNDTDDVADTFLGNGSLTIQTAPQ